MNSNLSAKDNFSYTLCGPNARSGTQNRAQWSLLRPEWSSLPNCEYNSSISSSYLREMKPHPAFSIIALCAISHAQSLPLPLQILSTSLLYLLTT